MARTAYLWSAALLLVGALAVGNPTLRPAPQSAAPPASAVVAAPSAPSPGPARMANAVAAPAAVTLVQHGGAPAEVSSGYGCPDPAIAPFVVAVESSTLHGAVWVLGDGRRMARGPGGTPLLVELPRAAAK
ncbi:MAG: hypothetical protein FJ301_05495 [Planctomycetes bacterium]|nr:hypothetical protein [Planctomycetota bacterium]